MCIYLLTTLITILTKRQAKTKQRKQANTLPPQYTKQLFWPRMGREKIEWRHGQTILTAHRTLCFWSRSEVRQEEERTEAMQSNSTHRFQEGSQAPSWRRKAHPELQKRAKAGWNLRGCLRVAIDTGYWGLPKNCNILGTDRSHISPIASHRG